MLDTFAYVKERKIIMKKLSKKELKEELIEFNLQCLASSPLGKNDTEETLRKSATDSVDKRFDEKIKNYDHEYEKMLAYANCPIADPGNIRLSPIKSDDPYQTFTIFAVNDNGTKRIFKLVSANLDDLKNEEFKYPVYITSLTFKDKGKLRYFHDFIAVDFTAKAYSMRQIARFVAVLLDLEENEVSIEIEEPITYVNVYKLSGLPVYVFNINDIKHVATIEKCNDGIRDYVVKISTSSQNDTMLDFSRYKPGKLFRTVLMKRLNDWFKETYGGRAQFRLSNDEIEVR